jgi:hypothetical protein
MSDVLQNRLTKNLLDLIEANNYYWDIIREKNSIITQQHSDLKILKQQNKKLLKLLNHEESTTEVLKQQIRQLKIQQENNQKRTQH